MRKAIMIALTLTAALDPATAQQPPNPTTASQVAAPARPRVPPIIRKSDVIYCRVQGSALLADLAYIESDRPKPAVVYVWGGRWRAGSRLDNQGNWERLAKWSEDGYFTMTIDHRLVEATPAPAPYQDTLCGLRWLHAHAAEYNVDANQIFIIGNSSGGHLAALAAMLGDNPKVYPRTGGWDNARSDVRAGIAIAAPYELNTLSWGNLWTPLGTTDLEAARRQASPLHQISSSSKALLVVHSDDDKSVPIQQAIDMVRALEAAKTPHKFVHYRDRGHMGLTDEVLREARAFVEQTMKGSN